MPERDLPLVTIITPTYNRGDLLPETMDSILSQDYPRLEYIVLDDGSKDDTIDILRKYKRVIWDSHPNMGPVKTNNKGFSMATGQIIGVVNSDDPLKPRAITNIVKYMSERPDVGVVYPDWDLIDLEGNLIQHMQTFEYSFINMLRWHYCIPGPGTLFRREVINSLGGQDPQFKYAFDYEFWLRAGLITQFARIPMSLATFRQHSGAITSESRNRLMAEEHVRLISKLYSLPNLPPEVLALKHEAFSSAYFVTGCVCKPNERQARNYYFFRALTYAPLKYFGEYKHRITTMLEITFPSIRPIRSRARALRAILSGGPRRMLRATFDEVKRMLSILLTDPKRAIRAIQRRIRGPRIPSDEK